MKQSWPAVLMHGGGREGAELLARSWGLAPAAPAAAPADVGEAPVEAKLELRCTGAA